MNSRFYFCVGFSVGVFLYVLNFVFYAIATLAYRGVF